MCAWAWSDSFDPYAAVGDATLGYWDSGAAGFTLQTGRFAGSQCVRSTASANIWFTKASTANDSVHHISFATQQTSALSGSNLMHYFQLLDGTTGQCAVVFRIDGAILLTSGTPAGTVLATYTGAISAQSTWTQFEIEVVVHNSTGGMRVRKNGSSTNDYDSFISVGNLDTAGGTVNNYANKLTIGSQTTAVSTAIYLDDLIWRSDAASVAWIGDVRIVARAPASDVQAQFSRSTGTTNFGTVDEAQQNGATDYVFSSTVGQNDLYGLAALSTTPQSVFGVTTRMFCQKSDAGTRNGAVQLKSGATTVQSTSTALSTSFGWLWRVDTTDPATGSAWTVAAANNAQIGPVCTL